MEQKINIAELLIEAPSGTILYSPLYGECKLDGVTEPPCCDIVVEVQDSLKTFNNAGYPYWTGNYDKNSIGKECMLFPSKKNRDWSTFKAPRKYKNFNTGDKVLTQYWPVSLKAKWQYDIYSHFDTEVNKHITLGAVSDDDEILPYEGNEDLLGKEVE